LDGALGGEQDLSVANEEEVMKYLQSTEDDESLEPAAGPAAAEVDSSGDEVL
jgi:hypothetical protein